MKQMEPYQLAQSAVSDLKSSVYIYLKINQGNEGLTNAELGRALGIYSGHVGHEGHISRTILAIMESESVVEQDESNKKWKLK